VAFSPSGQYALVGSQAGPELRLWDWKANAPPQRYSYPIGQGLTAVAFSQDKRRFLCCTAGGEIVRAYELSTGKCVLEATAKAHPQHAPGKNPVTCMAFSADAKHVLVGMAGGVIRQWITASGKEGPSFNGHPSAVRCLTPSVDGRLLLSGGDDATVRLWEIASRKQKVMLQGHTRAVLGVALSRDGRFALSGGDDNTIRSWDIRTGQELKKFIGHTAPVHGVAISPNGKLFASASADKTVRLWQLPHESAPTPRASAGE
jgi:WD40 repeat protein